MGWEVCIIRQIHSSHTGCYLAINRELKEEVWEGGARSGLPRSSQIALVPQWHCWDAVHRGTDSLGCSELPRPSAWRWEVVSWRQAERSDLQFVAGWNKKMLWLNLSSQEKIHSDSPEEYQVNPKTLTYGLNGILVYRKRRFLMLLHKSALHFLQ